MVKKNVFKNIEHEHLAAILCYFLIGIIWFFADEKMKKSSLIKFHSKQVINLCVVGLALHIGSLVLFFVGFLIMWFVGICILVLWVIGLIHALNAEEKPIPIIGGFAKQYLKY